MRGWLLLVAGGLVLAGVAGGLAVPGPGVFGTLGRPETVAFIGFAGVSGTGYAVAVGLARRGLVVGWGLGLVVGVGVMARLAVLVQPPILSTDLYRYVWDGVVQAGGFNPYCCLPVDPVLAGLRDGGLGPWAVFANINRAETAPTIYPPGAQMLFALMGVVGPGVLTVKAVMMGFDLLTLAVGALLLRAAVLPAGLLVVWAWNPLVIWEFAGGGHVDAAAIGFSALAMLAAVRGRRAWAGAALGGAVLMKLLPAALFPALWRRWDWRVPVVAGVVIVAAYGAYAGAGWRVLGYLPGYAQEEELHGGGGFLILRLLSLAGPLPGWAAGAYLLGGLILLGGMSLVVVRRPFPAAVAARARLIGRDALMLSGALVAVLSPHYPWYLTSLVLPAMLVPAWSVVWLTVAAPLLYLDFALEEMVWPALVFLPVLPLLWVDALQGAGTRESADV